MKVRRRRLPRPVGEAHACALEVLSDGHWLPLSALNAAEPTHQAVAWLAPLGPDAHMDAALLAQRAPADITLPLQARSFRDCALFEQHWIQSSRGYVRRFMPGVHAVTRTFEAITGRPFPAFRLHALGRRQPIYYFGNHLSFVPSGTPVRAPTYTHALDYELELGLVLRKPLHNATPEEALDAIGGFVVVNDWSARDIQRPEMQSGLGPQKCKHFLSSMSDTLVTADEVLARIGDLKATVEINGQTVARTGTGSMLFGWGEVLAHLSRDERLQPGELIASGTLPHGCGMETGRWVQPGDTLRLVIEGVGEIVHPIEA